MLKILTTSGVILVGYLLPAQAQYGSPLGLETTPDARQRHQSEMFGNYTNRGNQAPLGGYQERLGDPAPYGTQRPGYVSPYDQVPGGFQPSTRSLGR